MKYIVIILLFIFCSCKQKSVNDGNAIRIYYDKHLQDTQYGVERYLDESFRNYPNQFFKAPIDSIKMIRWDSLMNALSKLERYRSDMPDVLHLHNYCSNLEVELYEKGVSVCQLCLNPGNKTLRMNNLVYCANPKLVSFFRNYISKDSLAFVRTGKGYYTKEIIVKTE